MTFFSRSTRPPITMQIRESIAETAYIRKEELIYIEPQCYIVLFI